MIILLRKFYVAHNSLMDVQILHELFTKKMTCHSADPFHIYILQKCLNSGKEGRVKNIAGSGLRFQHLILAHKRDEVVLKIF